MKKIIRLTEADLTRLVRRVLKEQITIPLPATDEDPNYHRYDQGANMPGLEKFLANPLDDTITAELMSELKTDRFAKGKIIIIFNGAKYKEVESFIQKIQSDARRNRCYTVTDYNYNNRVGLNTQITITATPGECKKNNSQVQPDPVKPNPVKPKPIEKKCKHSLEVPANFNTEKIREFQQYCFRRSSSQREPSPWRKDFKDRTSQACSKDDIDGIWGCCTATCWSIYNSEKNYTPTIQ
jgi:hypothetical protein